MYQNSRGDLRQRRRTMRYYGDLPQALSSDFLAARHRPLQPPGSSSDSSWHACACAVRGPVRVAVLRPVWLENSKRNPGTVRTSALSSFLFGLSLLVDIL
jgi:hypothetical protein